MSRHPDTLKWLGSIAIAVVLALTAACSKPAREAAPDVVPEKTVEATPTPAPPKPEAPAPVTHAPAPSSDPTPSETPVTADAVPAPPTSTPKPTPAEAAPDPLKWLQESEAKRVEYEANLAKLAADLETAKANLTKSQRDLLAFRNPYLARPVLTDAQSGEVQGLNGAERVKWAETRVADGIASVEAAQKAYDDAKANPPVN